MVIPPQKIILARRRSVLIVATLFFFTALVLLAGFFYFRFVNTAVYPTAVISPAQAKAQPVPAIVAGKPITWQVVVDPSQIKNQNQRLVQLPPDARNIKVTTTTKARLASMRKCVGTSCLTADDRKQLALPLKTSANRQQSLFPASITYALSYAATTVTNAIAEAFSSAITIKQGKFVDISNQLKNIQTASLTGAAQQNNLAVVEYQTAGPAMQIKQIGRGETVTISYKSQIPNQNTEKNPNSSNSNSQNVATPGPSQIEPRTLSRVNGNMPATAGVISSPAGERNNGNYGNAPELTNVVAYAVVPELYKVGEQGKIQIRWSNNQNAPVTFTAFDLNDNGKIDYIEWIVPHLSTQTFEIIYITKAVLCDGDKQPLQDIYDKVKARDNVWQTVNANQFVKVTFQKQLTNKNDITLYARAHVGNVVNDGNDGMQTNSPSSATTFQHSNNTTLIEVYPVYQTLTGERVDSVPVAVFPQITAENTYKILLTNLKQPTDTFYLKVVNVVNDGNIGMQTNSPSNIPSLQHSNNYNSSIDIDYIVDPSDTILHSFSGDVIDGKDPGKALALVGSAFYGMTSSGGANNKGTIFSIVPSQSINILHTFAGGASDGDTPFGALTASGTKLYGMTSKGGTADRGVIFSINANGSGFTILHTFTLDATNGNEPYDSLIISDSTLYGMTRQGGSAGAGAVFSISADGTGFTILHSFAGGGGDGGTPTGSLLLLGSLLYGMTSKGGSADDIGIIFYVNTNGTGYTRVHTFTTAASDGSTPLASLIISGSVLYGTTSAGGASGYGNVFSCDISAGDCINGAHPGSFNVLHDFAGGVGDGVYPRGSLLLSGSTLYGTTAGGANGATFKINTNGSGFDLITTWGGGHHPGGTLIISGSTLYGTAGGDGLFDDGAIIKVNTDTSGADYVWNFHGSTLNSGGNPRGDLISYGGKFYGMTKDGGSSNKGTVFSINTDGTDYTVLRNFAGGAGDGEAPFGSLALSTAGTPTLYGMTNVGGGASLGIIFKMYIDGTGFTSLRDFVGFGDAANPYGSLLLSGSTIYGLAYSGGWGLGGGTIFKINTDGTGFSMLKDFNGTNEGGYPYGSLALSTAGTPTLYGMTTAGGASGNGVIFSIPAAGTIPTVLHDFTGGAGGANPYGSLILSGTTLYGMTRAGGAFGGGIVFKIETSGADFSVLRDFGGGAGGANPYGSLILSGTTLYGITSAGGGSSKGAAFSIKTDGTAFTVLYSFAGGVSDGETPYGSLALSTAGTPTLYGMTSAGGAGTSGVIFSLAVPSSLPSFTAWPSDGGSSAGTPTAVGSDVNFTGTATDPGSADWRMLICQTNSATAPATCDGGSWCVSSAASSGAVASCNYTTTAAGSSAWYAFACNTTDCSASSQGSGDNGSPFVASSGGGGGGGNCGILIRGGNLINKNGALKLHCGNP